MWFILFIFTRRVFCSANYLLRKISGTILISSLSFRFDTRRSFRLRYPLIWIHGLPPPWVPIPWSWVFAISNTINTSICIRDSLNIFNLPQWGIPWIQMHSWHCCFQTPPHTVVWYTLHHPYCTWCSTFQTTCQRVRICKVLLLHSSPGKAAGTQWCSVFWWPGDC